jgi:GTP pyrophosphokinase
VPGGRLTDFLDALPSANTTLKQAGSIQKMLFALADDADALPAVLVGKMDALNNASDAPPEEKKRLGEEALAIWAPLADRLGMSPFKSEFEDLGLKYTNNEAFLQIQLLVAHNQAVREALLDKAEGKIAQAAAKAGIDVAISGRAKHFYSIYLKMRKRKVQAAEIFDLLAIRILCGTVLECYTLAGIVHGLWKPVDGHFKDYIGRPKPNGYQSLHTAVDFEGNPLEIQIRTREMHEIAEHGVASHWLYKQQTTHRSGAAPALTDDALADDGAGDNQLFEAIREKFLGKSIFVLTPLNDVIELPQGATAIDFAYAVHSAIGQKIVAAKVEGRIIPLSEPLRTTQRVEILTTPQAHPTPNQLQYVKTQKARSKIRAYLLQNEAAPPAPHKAVSPVPAAAPLVRPAAPEFADRLPAIGPRQVIIGNTRNFLVTYAKCCHPDPGDPIVGYVSRGRGVIIHRTDCRSFLANPNSAAQTIDAQWEQVAP